ncbi:hypothetical protein QE435_003234 [Rhizobium sp. SORGH_AS 787]|nr:hypothetical protein [Rhizobium sp. SORGH_AS_0787]
MKIRVSVVQIRLRAPFHFPSSSGFFAGAVLADRCVYDGCSIKHRVAVRHHALIVDRILRFGTLSCYRGSLRKKEQPVSRDIDERIPNLPSDRKETRGLTWRPRPAGTKTLSPTMTKARRLYPLASRETASRVPRVTMGGSRQLSSLSIWTRHDICSWACRCDRCEEIDRCASSSILDTRNKKGRGEFAPTSCRLSSAASTSVVNVQAVAPPRHSTGRMRGGVFGSKF